MDSRFGFIHEKLDIKILILFILQRLPEPIEFDTLAELTLCDDGISFFDFAECVDELVKTGHISDKDGLYVITEKGARNGKITESGIPYSVRIKAEKSTTALAVQLKRNSLISTSHSLQRRGGCTVDLSMSDGIGSVINLKLLVGSEAQAAKIEQNFCDNAEDIYAKITKLLMSE